MTPESEARVMVDRMMAIAEEFGVDPRTAMTIIGLQLLAMMDGCERPEQGMAWALERGYVEPTGSPDPLKSHAVTNDGVDAVRAWLAP